MLKDLLALLCLLFCLPSFAQPGPLQVRTVDGIVEGKMENNSIRSFKGIPFAAPPIGDLRWKTPQPNKPWPGVLKTQVFSASPMQGKPVPFSMWSAEFLIPAEPISEDCLYLNIWAGSSSAKEKRAVLVWIYGGGFNSGGAGVPIYDGQAMAEKGIVFVSINYRVGVFGFFAHPELTKESGYNASGNYGLLDQIAALKWVKQNIAAFGGDPTNVTIAGQSAGSMSVNALVASPLAKGLFNKAIAQSGAGFTRNNASLKFAEEDGMKQQQKAGASSIADLRKMPADEVFKKIQSTVRGPIIDGHVLTASIAEIFNLDKQNDVALLTGWNQDEGLLFGPIKNAVDFRKQVAQQYGADSSRLLEFYPANTDAEAATAQLNLSRDITFGVQNYTWANIEASRNMKVFVYRFSRKVPATGDYLKYGAFHTGEVPYAYDNLKFVDRPWETVDHTMAKVISGYWVNFIKKGDPNADGLPLWPLYTKTLKQIMDLNTQQNSKQLPDVAALDFLFSKTAPAR